MFFQKYKTNPYFKTKVDLMVKKEEQKQVKRKTSLENDSDDE